MWLLNLFLLIPLLAGYFLGSRPWFRLDRLNSSIILNSILIVLLLFTCLTILYVLGLFPQNTAAIFMMAMYTILSGFFIGYATRLWKQRKAGGIILYQQRSFWIDHAPNLLAIILILFGLYRTALITDQAITGIRFTSGFSLMSFGFFAWLFKVVPEFRAKGVLLLDKLIEWDEILSWRWVSDSVLMIEYVVQEKQQDQRIRDFVTSVPLDEKKEIESVLKSKMDEYSDDRKKKLFQEPDD